jgi:hypothetical protein
MTFLVAAAIVAGIITYFLAIRSTHTQAPVIPAPVDRSAPAPDRPAN